VNERLLHFIWQFQYFNRSELETTAGDSLQIISPGQYNKDQGPDFTAARIQLANTTWAGTIELHIRTSDWTRHRHEGDSNYQNVILHVVWEDDCRNPEGRVNCPENLVTMPTLELKHRVPGITLQRYDQLMNNASYISCEKLITSVPALTITNWKERLLAERLLRKSTAIHQYLEQNNQHWEETFWWMLASGFGMKVNAEAFERVARSIPLNILARHRSQIHQLEALLLGQAGLLSGKFEEEYPRMLKKEFRFLRDKYRFRHASARVLMLRMRPVNFPTIRLAQLAMLVHQSVHLFSKIKEAKSVKEIRDWLDVTANDYWHYHYRFDEPSACKPKKLGDHMVGSIIVNTIVPIVFAYGVFHGDQGIRDKALRWLEEVPPEVNTISRKFQELGLSNKSAFDTQALVELKSRYCDCKRCLECAIGNHILKN
jgi:hypothetical protein